MRKTVTLTYPAAPDTVATMLADPEFQRGRVARLGLADLVVEASEQGGGLLARIAGRVPAERLPSAARRLVRSDLSFTLTESWGAAGADGARTGRVDVAVSGAPVKVGAASTMRGDGERTTVVMDLSLDVRVPLVGRTIEEKAVGYVDAVVADEQRRAAAWLAAR